MSYKAGSFDAARFKDEFGLETVDEGEAYSEGSTTGTKQVGAIGTYMTKDDYNRLKDSDKVWDAYAAINGEEAAKKKRESGDMSINTLDGLMDKLSVDKPKEKASIGKEKEKYVPSEKIKQAVERVEKFEQNDYNIFDPADNVSDGDSSAQHYLEQYKLNLRAKEPKVAAEAVK